MQTQNNTIHCKISFENQLRRASLLNPTFKDLEALIRQLFSLTNEKLSIKYKDEEQDLITLETDIELQTALYSLLPTGLFRLIITLVPQNTSAPSMQNVPLQLHPSEDQSKFKCMKHHFKRMKLENPEHAKQIKTQFKQRKQAFKAQSRQEEADFIRLYNATFSPFCTFIPNVPSSTQSVSFTITNTGSATWPEGTSVVPVGKFKTNEKIVLSASVAPGACIPLTTNVIVSDLGGHFSKWRLMLPNQVKFGAKFWIKTQHFSPRRAHCRVDSFQKKRFCEGVMHLKEMGFQGRKLWWLLKQYDGDVDRVVADLLSDKERAEKA